MTIDEAIANYQGVSNYLQRYHAPDEEVQLQITNAKCAKWFTEAAEWLQELRAYRKLRICGNCRHYVVGTTHFGECHVTSDIEPCVVSINQTACDTFFEYKDFRNEVEKPKP